LSHVKHDHTSRVKKSSGSGRGDGGELKLSKFLRDEVYPRLSPEDIFTDHSHEWQKTKTKWRGGCPWHESKSKTAFYVDVDETGFLWRCPQCNTGGAALEYLWKREHGANSPPPRGEDFLGLLRRLCELAGVPFPERQLSSEEVEDLRRLKAREAILRDVYAYCSRRLHGSHGEQARAYLLQRGLDVPACHELQLGLYPPADELRKYLLERGHHAEDIKATGVVVRRMEGYILFPWLDERGQPLTAYGRWPGDPPRGEPKTRALPNPKGAGDRVIERTKRAPLYMNRAVEAAHDQLVLVEGVLDAALLQALGDSRTVACVAAHISQEQLETLRRRRIKSVVIALDPDEAGDAAVRSNVEKLRRLGIKPYVVDRLPDGQDPDEFVLAHGIDVWRERIEKAAHGFRHVARSIIKGQGDREPGDDSWADQVTEDALAFAAALPAEHDDELTRHFWTEIAQATCSRMDDLRMRLAVMRRQSGNGSTEAGAAGASTAVNGPVWPAAVPLPTVPDAPPFPLDTLPPSMAGLVEEIGWAMNCPPDLAAVALLTLAGGAVANARHIAITDTHFQSPCLFAAVVAPPGMAKSPPLRLLRQPFDGKEKAFRTHWQNQMAEWQKQRDERKEKKGKQKEESEPRPKLKRCLVSNTTTESLQIILNENPRGVLMIRNEVSGLVAGMNQYKQGGDDRQFYLDLWDGTPIITDRKSDRQLAGAPVFVRDAFTAIYGTIQPDVVGHLRAGARRGEQPINDGFLDRWLLAFPQELPAVEEQWRAVSAPARTAWDNTVKELLSLEMQGADGPSPRPELLHLSPDGKLAWKEFTRRHAAEMNDPDFPSHLRGPWAKLRGYCARIGLILQCLRWACEGGKLMDVDGESMEAAARLVDYFKGHACKLYMAMGADPALAGARKLLAWLRKPATRAYLEQKPTPGQFSKREAYMGTRPTFETVPKMEPSLTILERHHVIRPVVVENPKPGRPSELYEAHPDLFRPHEQYAQKAQNPGSDPDGGGFARSAHFAQVGRECNEPCPEEAVGVCQDEWEV
jgi:5S rRNA maturation endonuclease (ribonuclease M5)